MADRAEAFKELSRASGHLYRAKSLVEDDEFENRIDGAISHSDRCVDRLVRILEDDVVEGECEDH